MKSTAVAPSNIAFTKYWGKKDDYLRIPTNNSISMNLSNLTTTTTVEFSEKYSRDEVIVNGESNEFDTMKVSMHLDRIRKRAGTSDRAKVMSLNTFPSSTGLSSSASGFAALTVAAVSAVGLSLSQKELSVLARLGSGSACRSIPDGFVEWKKGNSSPSSYAVSLFSPDHWNIRDVVVLVSDTKKSISTTEGQKRAQSSLFFPVRLSQMDKKNERCRQFIEQKNLALLGELIESEALEMHAVMMTASPPLLYWLPTTVLVIKMVQKLRAEGLSCYFTINTGQDIHIICEEKTVDPLTKKLEKISEVKKIMVNKPSIGTQVTSQHLF